MIDSFLQRKKAVLSKLDKSSKGSWDKKIISLCEKINEKKNFYTTSSCSGRIILMIDQEKKGDGLFLKMWHDKISFEEFKKKLGKILGSEIVGKNIKFKSEPPILHVACENLTGAQELLDKARAIGWRRSGIITSEDRIIVELNSTERLEFPIIAQGKILARDEFLKIVVGDANNKLERGWEKIKELEKKI